MTALQSRFDTAVQLATEAGALAMRMRASAVATMKGPQDWVTDADIAVERFLSDRLRPRFPDDGFQGEEGGQVRSGSLRWVVDPIDGTANYMRRRQPLLRVARLPGGPHAADRRAGRAGAAGGFAAAPAAALWLNGSPNPRGGYHIAEPGDRGDRLVAPPPQQPVSRARPARAGARSGTATRRIRRAGAGGCRRRADRRLCRTAHQSVGCRRRAGAAARGRRRRQRLPGEATAP